MESAPSESKRGYSWWSWRRSGGVAGEKSEKQLSIDETKDSGEVATQTSRSNTPGVSNNNHASVGIVDSNNNSKQHNDDDDNRDDLEIKNELNMEVAELYKSMDEFRNEKYRKSLRLTTDQIVIINDFYLFDDTYIKFQNFNY